MLKKRDLFLNGPGELAPGTLAEFIERIWWPRMQRRGTYATQVGYMSVVKEHISRFYGYQVNDLRLEVLQPWISAIADGHYEIVSKDGNVLQSKPRSPKTVRNIYAVMSSILELAAKVKRYDHMDHKLVELPEVDSRKKRVDFTQDRIAKVCEAAKQTPIEGPVWTASHIGLRRNEICGLKRTQVVIGKTHATINLSDNRQRHGESTKLKSKKRGDVHELTIPKAWGEKLLSFGKTDSLYLFLDSEGKPISPDRITKTMARVCELAGVPKMTFHDLRAACRSNLEAAGAPELMIMAILNHATMAASARYQDRRPELEAEFLAKLGDA